VDILVKIMFTSIIVFLLSGTIIRFNTDSWGISHIEILDTVCAYSAVLSFCTFIVTVFIYVWSQ